MLALRRKRERVLLFWFLEAGCAPLYERCLLLYERMERERGGEDVLAPLCERCLLIKREGWRMCEVTVGKIGWELPLFLSLCVRSSPIPPRWQKELARSSGKRHNWLGIEPRSTYFCRLWRSRPVAKVNRELQGCVNLNSCCLCPHNQLLCPTSLSTFTHSAKKCGTTLTTHLFTNCAMQRSKSFP